MSEGHVHAAPAQCAPSEGGLIALTELAVERFRSVMARENLGANYGLVFLGWGLAFFVPQLAAAIKDATGRLDPAFYLSAGLLAACVAGSRFVRRPA